jgi:L-2,4-diaminobutyrate decarboxylase
MVATLQTLGRVGLAQRIERCFELTAYAAAALARRERFELALQPALTTVLFRYVPQYGESDQVNAALRRRLLVDGSAVVGRTRLPQRTMSSARTDAAAGPESETQALTRTAIASAAWPDAGPDRPVGPGATGALRLKLTLLNPETTPADLDRLIDLIAAAGAEEDHCPEKGTP